MRRSVRTGQEGMVEVDDINKCKGKEFVRLVAAGARKLQVYRCVQQGRPIQM